jgi:hypothetical protein
MLHIFDILTVLSAVVAANDRHCAGGAANLKCVRAGSGCRLSGRERNQIQTKIHNHIVHYSKSIGED